MITSYAIQITDALHKQVQDDPNSWHLKERAGFAGLIPVYIVASILDAAGGAPCAAASFATMGTWAAAFYYALEQLTPINLVLANVYSHSLSVLNPCWKLDQEKRTGPQKNGLLHHCALVRFIQAAKRFRNSENILIRHGASRLTYAVYAVAAVVLRAVDMVIGLGACVASLITYGKFPTINKVAYRALQFPGVINDLFSCAIKVINPWAGIAFAKSMKTNK